MSTDLINLLPEDAARSARRSYLLRLATVALGMLAIVIAANGVLLMPVYGYLKQELGQRSARLAELDQALLTTGDQQAIDRLAAIRTGVSYLGHLATSTSATKSVRLVLSVPNTGIHVQSFTFGPSPKGKTYDMRVAGRADTREALRNYDLALSSVPGVSNVNLPVSAYAKENDIDFVITLTGMFNTP